MYRPRYGFDPLVLWTETPMKERQLVDAVMKERQLVDAVRRVFVLLAKVALIAALAALSVVGGYLVDLIRWLYRKL